MGNDWDIASAPAWAELLGLVSVPMFAPDTGAKAPVVLLDGELASFAFLPYDDPSFDVASSIWSSYLRHAVLVDQKHGTLQLRRWDSPGEARMFRLPSRPAGVVELLERIQSAPDPRGNDVIVHVLRAFRQIRALIDDPVDSIEMLNLLLLGAEGVRDTSIDPHEWSRIRTVGDLVNSVSHIRDARPLGEKMHRRHIQELAQYFMRPEPASRCEFNASLLLRHASSYLYQEAHLLLERTGQRGLFTELGDESVVVGRGPRDVRFTPPSLARTLVQQSLRDVVIGSILTIVDPSCGSGIFLQEAIRELSQRTSVPERVKLIGIDKSPISASITRLCLERARRDLERRGTFVEVDVRCEDALGECSWGEPDLILMNPPFVALENLAAEDRDRIKATLGTIDRGRVDLFMAFVMKAAQAIRPDGVVASVVPAPFLQSHAGLALREHLQSLGALRLIGRFESLGYFRGALVETAFFILQRHHQPATQEPAVTMLLASVGAEDASLRALRARDGAGAPLLGNERITIVKMPSSLVKPNDWSPKSATSASRIVALQRAGLPTVGDLFEVRQGALTGNNKAFVVKPPFLASISKRERGYFRPCAGSSTIRDGRLLETEYVWYPYDTTGLMIKTEEELADAAPAFSKHLSAFKSDLNARSRIRGLWWKLAEERAWQREEQPKLVSAYFGDAGSFAYDETGRFVVTQGYAWLWRRQTGPDDLAFEDSALPLAYLALLNTRVFEECLACFCPRVQGGQFNLSQRYVKNVWLPDLSDDNQVSSDLVVRLASIGKQMTMAPLNEQRATAAEELAARAFRVAGAEVR